MLEWTMPDDNDDKPLAWLRIPSFAEKPIQQSSEGALPPVEPMRTLEELNPLVQRAAENPEIMKLYREAVGSEDQVRAAAVIDAITEFAQSIDPTVTQVEAVRITVGLMKMIGHPGEALLGPHGSRRR
jgi:hypothetical protein